MNEWQMEQIDRLARLEENIEYIKSNIRDLPQSPQCKRDIAALKEEILELETFKAQVEKRVAQVGGVLLALGMVIPYVFNWVASHIHWKGP